MPLKSLMLWLLALGLLFPFGMRGHLIAASDSYLHDLGLITELSEELSPLEIDNNCPEIWGSQVDTNKYDTNIQVYSTGSHFQWQISNDQGRTWRDLRNNDNYAGVTTNVLNFTKVEQSMKDHQYRLKISNSQCTVFSNSFAFPLAQIHLHPEDQCVEPYQQATFTAGATGEGLSYQWQANYGSHWFDLSDDSMYQGTSTNQLKVRADPYWMNGHQFRVDVTVKDGFTLSSGSATLYIGEENCPGKPTNKWTGARNRNWNNPANWSLQVLPNLESDAIIPGGLQRYPLIDQGPVAQAQNLIIESGAQVEINQHWLQISQDITADGMMRAGQGRIAFVGSQRQQLPGNLLENNRLGDLRIQNAAGVTLGGPVDISRSVILEEGVLQTHGNLRLLSTAAGTALIDGSGSGSISGHVKMQRYLEKGFGYKYMSSPFRSTIVGDFAAYVDLNSSFPSFYRYQENHKDPRGNDISGWVRYTDPDSPIIPMQGYALNFGTSSTPLTLELGGEVNQGDYLLRLENNSGTYTQGFHLVGNPYPSPIDWDAPGWTKRNIDNGIYFFTASEDSQYAGTYTSYVSGVSSDGSESASSVIASMQGFFVHVSDPLRAGETVYGQLGMTDAVRVNNYQPRLFRATFSSTPARTLLRLAAELDQSPVPDHMVVYFNGESSESYDGTVEALKLINTDTRIPNIYSLTPQDKKLSINAVADIDVEETRVPLGLTVETSGNMSISLNDLENFPAGMNVYLIDRDQKRITNLINNSYSFHISSGVYDKRFELLLSRNTQALEARAFEEPFSVHPGRGVLKVVLNPKNTESGLVSVYSISGHLIETRQISGQEPMEFHTGNTGIYIVVLEDGKQRFTKKILVN